MHPPEQREKRTRQEQPEPPEPNYDESKVAPYRLPELLVDRAGRAVDSPERWAARREELLELLAEHVYGRTPRTPVRVTATQEASDTALDGAAVRTQTTLRVANAAGTESTELRLLVFRPRRAEGPVPVFLGLNMRGNPTVHPDPGILPSASAAGREPAPDERGVLARRFPLDLITGRGYALATLHCGDSAPDDRADFATRAMRVLAPAQPPTPADCGGAIGTWAWSLSLALDHLGTVPEVDAGAAVVFGHSRLGKAALWAAARDTRFAAAVSNDSGAAGASLFRREFGETAAWLAHRFPYWFGERFAGHAARPDALPVDQHMLLALIAPRPLYVASATDDLWADPRGEFLAARAAGPAYRLLGAPDLDADDQPPPDTSTGTRLAYHRRTGAHDLTAADWRHYLDFADREVEVAGRR